MVDIYSFCKAQMLYNNTQILLLKFGYYYWNLDTVSSISTRDLKQNAQLFLIVSEGTDIS